MALDRPVRSNNPDDSCFRVVHTLLLPLHFMKLLIQRVSSASVSVVPEGNASDTAALVSSIGYGMLVLVGIETEDTRDILQKQAQKLLKFRIFADEQGKMNRSVVEIDGDILVVSQFTLAANCERGNRPSFEQAKKPDEAKTMVDDFIQILRELAPQLTLKEGVFGAHMQVNLTNDGPVTFMLDTARNLQTSFVEQNAI